tara:strand:+ start:1995 stop:2555 length:561 start_codon:yes stop_codon:yes gene_type:complete
MKFIIVLSHQMDQNAKLGPESQARANLASDTFFNEKCDFILTLGWDYRLDSEIPIAYAFRSFLENKGIPKEKIISDINSRDTVGDAIFSKIYLVKNYKPKTFFIISSDYHIKRVEIIFKSIYGKEADLNFLSCPWDTKNINEGKEIKSINAFLKTFKDIDFENNDLLVKRLSSQHPFYNGEVFREI